MENHYLDALENAGILDGPTAANIRSTARSRPFSLHWELNTLLYLGVAALNIGLGILIYQNIDTIGHAVLIGLVGLLSACCFWYAWKHRQPFSMGPVGSPTHYYDYAVMLGCFTFVIMLGYWQYQYQLFGERYGLATLVPTVVLYAIAYRFDHRGALTLALTGLAAWVGISATPQDLLKLKDFNTETLIYTGIAFGVIVPAIRLGLAYFDIKRHFTNTYLAINVHIFFIATLCAMIMLDRAWLFFPVLVAGVVFYIWYARLGQSFWFLTAAVVYGYIGLTYLLFSRILSNFNEASIYFGFFYFIISCAGVILFLMRYKQLLKTDKP